MTLRVSSPGDFRAFYVQHYGFVCSIVRRLGVEGPSADDAVQDTFVAAYRRRGDYTGCSPKPWLYGIARRVASNHRRTVARGRERQRVLCEFQESAREGMASRRAEAIVELERVLSSLPREDRELFFLSEVDGLSGPELATALRLNPNTVYWRIRKLRGRLAAAVADRDAAVEELQTRRPHAEASGWVALLPLLQAVPTGTVAAPWIAGALFGIAALGVTSAVILPGPGAAPVGAVAGRNAPAATAAVEPTPAAARQDASSIASLVAAAEPSQADGRTRTPTRVTPSTSSSIVQPREAVAQVPAPEHVQAPSAPISEEALRAWNRRLRAAWEAMERGDARAALALTEAQGEVPPPPLEDLRTTLRIESLCALGDLDGAHQTAARFLRDRPSTAMRGRIARSCAGVTTESRVPGQP